MNKSDILRSQPDLDQLLKKMADLEAELASARNRTDLFSNYLSGLSHDIRTPLNSIVGFASLLSEPGVTEEERIMYSNMITRSSRRLLSMISNLIDLAKIQRGKLGTYTETIYIDELFDDLEDEMKEELRIYEKHSVKFKTIAGENGLTIRSDRARVSQILKIILDNSLKYTSKGKIELALDLNDPSLPCFSVTDTGVGMDEKTLHSIFELFPVDSALADQKIKSRGLGMLMVQSLLNLLDGFIHIDSEPGKGTTVKVCVSNQDQ